MNLDQDQSSTTLSEVSDIKQVSIHIGMIKC